MTFKILRSLLLPSLNTTFNLRHGDSEETITTSDRINKREITNILRVTDFSAFSITLERDHKKPKKAKRKIQERKHNILGA